MLKTLLKIFVVLNVIVLLVYGTLWLKERNALRAAKEKEVDTIAKNYEYSGVMSHDDYVKLRFLEDKVQRFSSLEDQDVDWLLSLRRAPLKQKPYAASLARTRPMGALLDAKLTPSQKEKVFQAALPMLSSTDKYNDDSDKIWGCNAMKTLRDKRAVPQLLPLLGDPRALVRERATRALNAINGKRP